MISERRAKKPAPGKGSKNCGAGMEKLGEKENTLRISIARGIGRAEKSSSKAKEMREGCKERTLQICQGGGS